MQEVGSSYINKRNETSNVELISKYFTAWFQNIHSLLWTYRITSNVTSALQYCVKLAEYSFKNRNMKSYVNFLNRIC